MARRPSTERREVERKRYNAQHKTLRAQWSAKLKRAHRLPCARCGLPIFAATPVAFSLGGDHLPTCTGRGERGRPCFGECWSKWELGHDDFGKAYTGPEHFACNRQAGGRKGADVKAAKYGLQRHHHTSRKP